MTGPLAPEVLEVVVSRARGDFLVHLSTRTSARALCGQELRGRLPHKSFREAGCRDCLDAALDQGQIAAQESDSSWINLRRVQPLQS